MPFFLFLLIDINLLFFSNKIIIINCEREKKTFCLLTAKLHA